MRTTETVREKHGALCLAHCKDSGNVSSQHPSVSMELKRGTLCNPWARWASVLRVPGRQLPPCPASAPSGGATLSSPCPGSAPQWSRMRCAVVCAQALSSRCPGSRHLGGWRSRPPSSERTWRHLATGEDSRPVSHATQPQLLSHPGPPSLGLRVTGRDQAGTPCTAAHGRR